MRPTMQKTFLVVTLALAALTANVQAEMIAITNGTLHTVGPAGKIEGGTVLIEDGKIKAVGSDISIPDGARIIDAEGRPVTPGFFDSLTGTGLSEVTLSAGIEDDEAKTSRFVIAADASYAFNPENTFVPSTRADGVVRTAISMKLTQNIFAGRGALVHLGLKDHVERARAFIFADLGERGGRFAGGSRAAAWVEFHAALREADNLTTQPRNHWQGGEDGPLYSHIDLEALQPAVQGEIPLIINVNRVADIRQVIKLKRERPAMRLVLYRATEAWRIADEIAKTGIPVLVLPFDNLPRNFDQIAATLENAALLTAAGVKIAIVGERRRNFGPRLLPQQAGNAVANGLGWEDALKAVTLAPAEIYGISDRTGSLEPGKDADVVIWSGDPFEVMEIATRVFIQGEDIPLVTRQTRLRDRYRTLNK